MPKALSHFRRPIGYQLNNVGDYALRERERLARYAMECIASFSTVESWMLNLYLDLVGGNKSDAAALFMKMESRATRAAALVPFISRLDKKYQTLYRAIEQLMKIRAKPRDKLAHWVWGISHELPEALLLANPKALATLDPLSPSFQEEMAKEIWVYEAKDFERIIKDNNELAGFGLKFRFIVQGHPANREDQLYQRLCSQPALAEILDRKGKEDRSRETK